MNSLNSVLLFFLIIAGVYGIYDMLWHHPGSLGPQEPGDQVDLADPECPDRRDTEC